MSVANCTPYQPYDSVDYAYVAVASAVSAFITVVASCFVIFILVLYKRWKYFAQRLVLYLSIAALLTGISTVLHRVDYSNEMSDFYLRFCTFGGFLEQITSWMILNAIVAITMYLFMSVIMKRNTEKLEVLYVSFIFLFPFLFNWIPFIHSSYGRSGAWCWIRSSDRLTCEDHVFGKVLIFVLWFVPLYVILISVVILYLIILVKLHRDNKKWSDKQTNEQTNFNKTQRQLIPLMAYPFIYIILSIPPLINRIQGLVNPDNPNLVLWYFSAISFPLQGGLIAIAYSLDPATRKKLTRQKFKDAFKSYTRKKTVIREYPAESTMDKSYHSSQYSKYEGETKSDTLGKEGGMVEKPGSNVQTSVP